MPTPFHVPTRRSFLLGSTAAAGLGIALAAGITPNAEAAILRDGRWCNPTRGYTVSGGEYWAPRGLYRHAGRDLATPTGTVIYAPAAGKVIRSGYSQQVLTGRNGWGLLIDHGSGRWTYYGHLRERSPIAVGRTVSAGQRIGYVGNTGLGYGNTTSGAHLHFEVHTGSIGNTVEPYGYLSARGVVLGGDRATGGPGHGWSYVQDGSPLSGIATVKGIQHLLNHRGHGLVVDGNFGSKSGAAVRSFQRGAGLVVDGDVGPKTWGKLTVTPTRGTTNHAVRALQQMLVKHGHSMSVDGQYGSVTNTAVRSFQSLTRLVVDGVVGKKTWQALVG
ncbi:peptidoglycan-binding protein [Microlunatus sp. Y2014]|uniref:peptidoglycan-binding protein n=1 Tax=Microlunatus sp. Y2014 TaxID=3418488 RepID=UPI003DA762D3